MQTSQECASLLINLNWPASMKELHRIIVQKAHEADTMIIPENGRAVGSIPGCLKRSDICTKRAYANLDLQLLRTIIPMIQLCGCKMLLENGLRPTSEAYNLTGGCKGSAEEFVIDSKRKCGSRIIAVLARHFTGLLNGTLLDNPKMWLIMCPESGPQERNSQYDVDSPTVRSLSQGSVIAPSIGPAPDYSEAFRLIDLQEPEPSNASGNRLSASPSVKTANASVSPVELFRSTEMTNGARLPARAMTTPDVDSTRSRHRHPDLLYLRVTPFRLIDLQEPEPSNASVNRLSVSPSVKTANASVSPVELFRSTEMTNGARLLARAMTTPDVDSTRSRHRHPDLLYRRVTPPKHALGLNYSL
ncbi:hypothetical protein T265_06502 [Opisthorchis viverrini]|uniref:Uncharacterized protein n=1 Tax=Opisthorchis viverrini TaxID=6198 RepID=A0A075ADR9_OPIVI|nr:hypothetical protein T265_06502 [Opisthorchis viverrini]KER26224.1 hypothetical protein T265_06502 [Opisthorchis viverrini]